MRAAEALIEQIVASSAIPSRKRRLEVARELRCHVEDFVSDARKAGQPDDEIEKMVLANWGDPLRVAHNFAWVYRHERAVRGLLIFALSTLAVAALSAAGTLTAQAGVAAGFGISLLHTLASRHTVIEALDILSTVAAYLGLISLEKLFRTHPMAKAVAVLCLMLAIAVGSATVAGVRAPFLIFGFASALFLRLVQVFLRAPSARFGAAVLGFGLLGVFFWARLPGLHRPIWSTLASWMVMGIGYQLMTILATRVDRELFERLDRR
jgi:hypothetical protein